MSALKSSLMRSIVARRTIFPAQIIASRTFIKPSDSAQDEAAKTRPGYGKHRQEVDPKMASVDQSMTFEEPKVRKTDIKITFI